MIIYDVYGKKLLEIPGANLSGANLFEANLSEAYLSGAIGLEQTIIVPDGNLIVYKKCSNDIIATLEIPTSAKRSNSTSRKCRAEYAKILSLEYNKKFVDTAHSMHDEKFKYEVGKVVKCDKWDENRWNECSGGIHFFLTRKEAEDFSL